MRALPAILVVCVLGLGCASSSAPETTAAQSDPLRETLDAGTACNARVVLAIKGLTCPSCKEAIQNSLDALHGVIGSDVELGTQDATVRYCTDVVMVEDLLHAVTSLGYGAKVKN